MLDKPDFLKGEVTEFIETNYGTKSVEDPSCIYRWDIKEFYSQKFSWEMVDYFTTFKNIIIPARLGINYYYLYSDLNYTLPLPTTLAHFISDCIRSGIKLEWRQK